MHTTSQQYAQSAFTEVNEVAKAHKKGSPFRQKYGSMAHRLPILIRISGLAQALAFVEAKAKKEAAYNKLLDDLAAAIKWPGVENGGDLAKKSRSESLDAYILLSQRVTAALIWYKRFAESVLEVKATDEVPEEMAHE